MNPEEIAKLEISLIGAMIDSPKAIDQAVQLVSKSKIFDEKCRSMFGLLCDLREAGLPTADQIVLEHEAKRRTLFREGDYKYFIGDAFLNRTTSVEYACREIAQAAEFRRLCKISEDFSVELTQSNDPKAIAEWLVSQVEAGRELTIRDRPEMIADVLERLAAIPEDSGRSIGSGIASLDSIISGFRGGQLIVLGARPSIGKSALGFQFARASAEQKNRSLYVSIEMPNSELAARRNRPKNRAVALT